MKTRIDSYAPMRRHLTNLAFVAGCLGVMPACQTEDDLDPEELVEDDEDEVDDEAQGKLTLVEEVGGETTVRFLDMDGRIVMNEEGPLGVAPRLQPLLDQDATALEAYMFLAPEADPPQALVDDHQLLASLGDAPAEPRELKAFRGYAGPYFDATACQSSTNWNTKWRDAMTSYFTYRYTNWRGTDSTSNPSSTTPINTAYKSIRVGGCYETAGNGPSSAGLIFEAGYVGNSDVVFDDYRTLNDERWMYYSHTNGSPLYWFRTKMNDVADYEYRGTSEAYRTKISPI